MSGWCKPEYEVENDLFHFFLISTSKRTFTHIHTQTHNFHFKLDLGNPINRFTIK